jgi:hypothetical protein
LLCAEYDIAFYSAATLMTEGEIFHSQEQDYLPAHINCAASLTAFFSISFRSRY